MTIREKLKEWWLIQRFLHNPQRWLDVLVDHFNTRREPICNGHTLFYTLRIESDIYGYEVRMGIGRRLLDCSPGNYGLSHQQGQQLYTAILTCIPSVFYHPGGRGYIGNDVSVGDYPVTREYRLTRGPRIIEYLPWSVGLRGSR